MFFTRLRINILFLLLSLFCATNFYAQNTVHSVQTGETLYSIARQYNLSVEQLLISNPGVTAENLKAGSTLSIPQHIENNKIANSDCREMHKVKKGETIYGIATKYGITEEALLNANPTLKTPNSILKKGVFLCIPALPITQSSINHLPQEKKDVAVSIYLPLKEKNEIGQRCVEFYRGFILAAEQLAEEGYNITLNVVNESNSNNFYNDIRTISNQNPNIIIGPLYPTHFQGLASLAQEKKTRLIIPFSSKIAEIENVPQVFMANAPDTYKVGYAIKLLNKVFPTPHAIFIEPTSGTNTSHFQLLKQKIIAQGTSFAQLTSFNDLLEYKTKLKSRRKNIFIINTNSIIELEQIAKLIAEMKQSSVGYDISLVVMSDTPIEISNNRNLFFAADTYSLTPSFLNIYSSITQDFINKYKQRYREEILSLSPSMLALGYDLGYQTIKLSAHYGSNYTTQTLKTQPHQTLFHFSPVSDKGGFINSNMFLIHYKNDGTIDQISL